jgi:hypothetical protein
MSQHTPECENSGLFLVCTCEKTMSQPWVVLGAGHHKAVCCMKNTHNEEEAAANARLIAQAPAMREALDNALTWWHSIPQHFNAAQEPKWIAATRAILAATPETP